MTDPTLTAEHMKHYATLAGKPILASWMGGAEVATGQAILNRAGIPTFPYPDTAARVFAYMSQYVSNLRGIYETPLPALEPGQDVPDRALVTKMVETARQSGRILLAEVESKQL